MPPTTNPANVPTPPPVGIVRCSKCGKLVECSIADLRNYMKAGWPRCCGEVMTYFAATEPPARLPGA